MRRVLFVDPSPIWGGAQESLLTLIQALDASEFDACLAGPSMWQRRLDGHHHALQHVAAARPLRSLKDSVRFLCHSIAAAVQLVKIVREEHPDLLHANGRAAWMPARLAAYICRLPLVWHARDLAGPLASDRFAAKWSDRCIAPSAALRSRLAGNVCVIPNGVDTRRFHPSDRTEARRALDLPVDKILVGMLGRWAPWKRVDLFLQAAAAAAASNAVLHFVLCGTAAEQSGQSSSDYGAALKGIGAVIEWTDDPAAVIQSLDLLVHTAEREAFGRVAVEAMSCAVPVIAADGGGCAETVINGVTGILFPPGDTSSLTEAILTLASDPAARERIGDRARKHVEANYSPALHARRVQEVYRELTPDAAP